MISWSVSIAAAAGALLLVASGLTKVVRPAIASAGMGALPQTLRRPATGVILGSAEIGIGGWWLAHPDRYSGVALSAIYVAFACYVAVGSRKAGGPTPCGCFGATDARAGRTHLIFNCTVAALAATAVFDGSRPLFHSLNVGSGLVVGLQVSLLALLSYVLLTEFGSAFAAWEEPAGVGRGHRGDQP